MHLAFVTSSDYPELIPEDQAASRVLHTEGITVVPAIWNDATIDWKTFDAVIIRSCWDYHEHPVEFQSWIDRMEKNRLHVWNPPAILRWNMDKRYLLDLAKKGIHIPRTVFLKADDPFDADFIRKRFQTDDVVIKPAISASAWKTGRHSLRDFSHEDKNTVSELRNHSDIIVQEFMPEITTEGEWSFIFFGRFSHSVRKYPAQDDFRVQVEKGGRYSAAYNPPPTLIAQAQTVVDAVDQPILYARVDGIERNGILILMELELIEPQLFFDQHPDAVNNFINRLKTIVL